MNAYFNLTHPDSERLIAEGKNSWGEGRKCSVATEHKGGFRRIGPLLLEVKHNRRDEQIICGWGGFLRFMKVFWNNSRRSALRDNEPIPRLCVFVMGRNPLNTAS